MSLKVFERMPFTTHPDKDGHYVVVPNKGSIKADMFPVDIIGYSLENGWNGILDAENAIADEDMKYSWSCWLKPYTIGKRNWYETIETMIDEVRQELMTFGDRELTDKEAEEYDNLDELYEHLENARDFAEVLK